MLRLLTVVVFVLFLAACSSKIVAPSYQFNPNKKSNQVNQDQYSLLVKQIENNLDTIWGTNEVITASKFSMVRYTEQYHTRGLVNFFNGHIRFETVDSKNPKDSLKKIIVGLLLMDANQDEDSIYLSDKIKISTNPFFKGQIKSVNGKDILNVKEATAYADRLINSIHSRVSSDYKHRIFYVDGYLVANHVDARASKYVSTVNKYSHQYGIDQRLVYSIIEIESSFNPFAVSSSGALGLMQIIPSTAGAHVFKVRGISGKPSKTYLFNPTYNISVGTHYLQILKNVYFKDIKNPTNLTYMMITSYNAGAGGTLRIFDKDSKKAIEKINRMSSKELYSYIMKSHTSAQAKRYLEKVSKILNKYY